MANTFQHTHETAAGNLTEAKSRLLVRNALFMYLRMGTGTILSLISSRIVLEQLGIDDFGVFAVVASVVTAMNFMSNSVSAALSRFYAFSIGKNGIVECKIFFNAALRIEIILGLVLSTAIFFGGQALIGHVLDLPQGSRSPAVQVLFWTTMSFFVTLVATPFKSAVIARERFGVFSVIELSLTALKLAGVLCLVFITGQKLVPYAIIIFTATTICSAFYVGYGFLKLPECTVQHTVSSKACRDILSFSGFDLYGNFCAVVSPQANQWIVNLFFGVALNAAYGVTMQVAGAVNAFVSGLLQVLRPRIIKEYAGGDIIGFESLLSKCSATVLLLMGCMVVPLFLNIDFVLRLWLKEVPYGTPQLCSIALFATIPLSLTYLSNCAMHATGRIKSLSVINGSLFLLVPSCASALFMLGFEPMWVFIVAFVSYTLQWLVGLYLLKKLVPGFNISSTLRGTLSSFLFIGACMAVESVINGLFIENWHRLAVDIPLTLAASWLYFTRFIAKEKTRMLLRTYLWTSRA